jgi:DNA-directed RNA polymerase specialized sigma24 family protein
LFSLNRHAWLNELKKRGRTLAREDKFGKEQEQVMEDVSQAITDRESTSDLMKLMDRLGEICKKILLLYYYENLSIKEILDELHYENEQVVRNKKYKCLKHLEQMVNDNPSLKKSLKSILHG